MASPLRIAASARDMGGAQQNAAFIAHCLDSNKPVEFCLLAQRPGNMALAETGLPVQSVWHDCRPAAEKCIADFRPHYVLVGLSFPGNGIDDALRAAAQARRIPCGAIQDFWGYLGSFRGEQLPDQFFVLDEIASQLTKANAGRDVACLVTGSPKHERYARRIDFSASEQPAATPPQVVFFSQPRETPGVQENIELFFTKLCDLPALNLVLKLHPREESDANWYHQQLDRLPCTGVLASSDHSTEKLLLSADVVVCCFSTIGLDHAYLQAFSPRPLGNLVYLNIGDAIKQFLNEQVGQAAIPAAAAGLGQAVRSAEQLLPALQAALAGEPLRSEYHRLARCLLKRNRAAERIWIEILRRENDPTSQWKE